MSALPFLIMLFVCIVMPLGFAWRIWRLDEPTLAGWVAVVADSAVFVALIMLVGRWDMAGMHTRWLLLLLLAAASLFSWLHHRRRPWRLPAAPSFWRSHGSTLFSLILFGAALAYVLVGLLPQNGSRQLRFPLQDGHFVVGQRGANMLLNHHAGHRAQDHAVDITVVGRLGFRAAGLVPRDPAAYAIFGARVVSPCSGEVTGAVDGLPDLEPPQMDPENPAGNNVVIACDGMLVDLSHLRRGSVAVSQGQAVEAGQLLGEVGNSGNTTEPHLHIHAVDEETGAAVPLTFDGATPVRNRSFVRP